MNHRTDRKLEPAEESAPILGSWRKLYIFVILQTTLLVLIFYLFTRYFE